MFDFRIIEIADGNQVIDRNLKTPYNSLTPIQMVEYSEMDKELTYMDRMKERRQRAAECKRKIQKNFIYKMACLCGVV